MKNSSARDIHVIHVSPSLDRMFEIWSDTPVDAPVEKNKREEDPDQDLESLVVPPVLRPAKSFAFYMSVLSLALMALITAWDATSLAIALPVCSSRYD